MSQSILAASMRSMGSTMVLTGGGAYLRWCGVMTPQVSMGLSKASLMLAMPALLFTTSIDCSQNLSTNACPDMRDNLSNGWPMLLLPVWYVMVGLLVGRLCVYVGNASDELKNTSIVAVAFSNSTSLPISLLAVLNLQLFRRGFFGPVNPLLYLSVYLVVYPLLQWGVGGWLMPPLPDTTTTTTNNTTTTTHHTLAPPSTPASHRRKHSFTQVPAILFILGNALAESGAKFLRHGFTGLPVPPRLLAAVVVGKCLVMPAVGVLTAEAIRASGLIPAVSASFYLVAMIVTATPTANSMIVMAELSGENKEALVSCVFVMYLFAPMFLTVWISFFVARVSELPATTVTNATFSPV